LFGKRLQLLKQAVPSVARRRLSGSRDGKSAPHRIPTLSARSYEDACVLSVRACGKRLSVQSYAILSTIRAVDGAMTPAL
jgi:predicted RNase H-like nuclease